MRAMITRTPRRDRFVIISKVPLEDSRLTWKARGLHAYLMSKPDHWQVREQQLVNAGPDGRQAVRTALRELERYGYIVRMAQSRSAGRFDTAEVVVLEEPISPDATVDGFPVVGLPVVGKSPTSEERISEEGISELSSLNTSVERRNRPYESDFETAWRAYPRKVAKQAAFKAYQARRRAGDNASDLLDATINYAASRAGQDETFTQHGATFYGPADKWRDWTSTGPALVGSRSVAERERTEELFAQREREHAESVAMPATVKANLKKMRGNL